MRKIRIYFKNGTAFFYDITETHSSYYAGTPADQRFWVQISRPTLKAPAL